MFGSSKMDNVRRTFPKKSPGIATTGHADRKKRERSSKRKQNEEYVAKQAAYERKESNRNRRQWASQAKVKAPSGANSIPLGNPRVFQNKHTPEEPVQKNRFERKEPLRNPRVFQNKHTPQETIQKNRFEKKESSRHHKKYDDDEEEVEDEAQKSMEDYLASYDKEDVNGEEMDEGHEEGNEARDAEEDDDGVNDEFREQIADMPLSEVMALRDKLGTKLYDKALFGADPATSSSITGQEPAKRKVFTRENAKRPREMSSKRPVSKFRNLYADQKLNKKRVDPRFDERCGEFNDFIYSHNYSFVKDLRSQEKNLLKDEMQKLRKEQPEKAAQIKDIVTRIENQERSEGMQERRKEKIRQLRADNMERMRQGKNPFFMKKSELKREELEERFNRLQSKGKLDKYLKRKTKKGMRANPAQGDTERFAFDDSD